MSNIFHTGQNSSKAQNPNEILGDLQRLTNELLERRSHTTEHKEIQNIEEALGQLKAAQTVVSQQISNSEEISGDLRAEEPSVEGLFADVPGIELRRGEVFSSYNGHGLSLIGYMRTNLEGLGVLLDRKAANTVII